MALELAGEYQKHGQNRPPWAVKKSSRFLGRLAERLMGPGGNR